MPQVRGEASDFVEVRVEQVEEEQTVPPTEPAETEAAPTPETPEESTPESRRQARRILREGAKHLKEQAKELRGTRSRPSSTTSPPESSLSPQTEARTQAFAKSKGRRESGEAAPADRKKQKLEALPRPPLPPVRHRTPPVEPRAASVPRPAEAPLAIEDQAAERPQLTQPVRPVRLQPRPKGSPEVRVPTPPRPPSPLPSSSASHREPHPEVERPVIEREGELPKPLDPTYGRAPVDSTRLSQDVEIPRSTVVAQQHCVPPRSSIPRIPVDRCVVCIERQDPEGYIGRSSTDRRGGRHCFCGQDHHTPETASG